MLDAAPGVLAWLREDGDERLLAAVNLGLEPRTLAPDEEATLLVSTDPARPSSAVRDLVLQPDEAVLLRLHGG
jgi:alpha-glucosidase